MTPESLEVPIMISRTSSVECSTSSKMRASTSSKTVLASSKPTLYLRRLMRTHEFTAETPRTQRLRRGSLGQVKYASTNPSLQYRHVEVYQQSDRPTAEFKICQKLG